MNPSEPVNPSAETAGTGPEIIPDAQTNPETQAAPAPKIAGYCSECGKALDETSVYGALGTIFCAEHRPAQAAPAGRSSGLSSMSQAPASAPSPSVFPPRTPLGPIALIAMGVLLLLGNLDIIDIGRLMRYWPALLIVMGAYMIYARLTASAEGKRDGR